MSEIKNLGTWLQESPLAMDSYTVDGNLVAVAPYTDHKGNQAIIALHLSKERIPRPGITSVVVDEIVSIHGRTQFASMLQKTMEITTTQFYVNEKTSAWLRDSRLQLPPSVVKHLQKHCNIFESQLKDIQPQKAIEPFAARAKRAGAATQSKAADV